MHNFIFICGSGLGIACFLEYAKYRRHRKRFYREVEYLNDCPFKFHLESKDAEDYIVFDLGNNTTLWSEYTFGIRSDGIYGVNYLRVMGLNGPYDRIKLQIGQSVFPIIESINTFKEWAKEKTFEIQWNEDFISSWNEMKKKLDNLRILEEKSKQNEKEKKSKNG